MNPLNINKAFLAPLVMSIPLLFALACKSAKTDVAQTFVTEPEPILEPKPVIRPVNVGMIAGPRPQRTQAVFNVSKDKIWPIIVAEIANSYPIHTLDRASGSVTTQAVQIAPASFFEFTFEGQRALAFLNAFDKEFDAAERDYIDDEAEWAEREISRFNEWMRRQRGRQAQTQVYNDADGEDEGGGKVEHTSYRTTGAMRRVGNILAELNKAAQGAATVRDGLGDFRASLSEGTQPVSAQTPEQQRILREKVRELALIKAQEQERARLEAKVWPLRTWGEGGRIWYIHILAVETARNKTAVTVKCHFPLAPEQQFQSSGVLENRILTQFERALKN
jgi:hypothetical protein